MTIDATFEVRDGLRSRIPASSALLKAASLDASPAEKSDQKTHDDRRREKNPEDARNTLEWYEIEPWQQQGSGHIKRGYRRANGSITECLYSLTYLHNETVNIYSHLIGAMLYLSLPTIMFATAVPPRWSIATRLDVLACSSYFLGVATCFVLSTAFHTLHPHSHALYSIFISFDILGILILMTSATAPLLHFAFACHPSLQLNYFLATVFLSLTCAATIALPRLRGPELGTPRAVLFATFGGVSFVIPAMHAIILLRWDEVEHRMALPWVGGLAGFNALAVGVYGAKFPELWYPGTFDIFGASHQLMHIFVLCAALSYTVGVFKMFDFAHGVDGVCW